MDFVGIKSDLNVVLTKSKVSDSNSFLLSLYACRRSTEGVGTDKENLRHMRCRFLFEKRFLSLFFVNQFQKKEGLNLKKRCDSKQIMAVYQPVVEYISLILLQQ